MGEWGRQRQRETEIGGGGEGRETAGAVGFRKDAQGVVEVSVWFCRFDSILIVLRLLMISNKR